MELTGTVDVSGVYNRTAQKAQHVAATLGCRTFESVAEIAADPDTDGVILITTPDQRQELVNILAEAGKHILIEKPLERTVRAASKIVETCEANNVRLGVVFQHRFRAGARRLTELVATGALGELSLVRADIPWWRDQAYYDAPGRGTYARDGGGVLISQAIHVLDLLLSLAGPVEKVRALCATTKAHKMEAEDFATAGIVFSNGALGSVIATTATYPGEAERIVIDGTLATAKLEAGHLRVMWRDGRTEEQGELSGTGGGADPMAFPCDWHRDLIADFADAIANARQPLVTGREALKVHEFIEALVSASREGMEISLA